MPYLPVSYRLFLRAWTVLLAAVAATCMAALPLSAAAQATPTGSPPPPELSRFDLYAGYGYINPGNSAVGPFVYLPINQGTVFSATAYFNRYLGVQAEGSIFPNGSNDCINTAQVGPIFRHQNDRLVPFLHVLGGGAKVGGPAFQACTWGWGLTGGGGVDYILPFFHNRFALRAVQADFSYSHVDFGPVDPAQATGGIADIYAYRLSAGLVLRLTQVNPPPAVQLGCTVDNANPFAGDPLSVTASPANLNLNKKTVYTWTTSGGHITGATETVTVNTSGLAPGDYTVAGHVSQGPRPSQQASCTAGFRIHAFEPPTMGCSATPATILPGESSTIPSTARRNATSATPTQPPPGRSPGSPQPSPCPLPASLQAPSSSPATPSMTSANRPPPTPRSPSPPPRRQPRPRPYRSAMPPSIATRSVQSA